MRSRNERERRAAQSHRIGDHSIGSREHWRGGGEYGAIQLDDVHPVHEDFDEPRIGRSTSIGDRGLYEMRGGLTTYSDHDDDASGHARRGWFSRIFGRDGDRDDDDDGDRDRDDGRDGDRDDRDVGARGPYHRSWFGGDDYDDDENDTPEREMQQRFRGARDVDDRVGSVQPSSDIGGRSFHDDDEPRSMDARRTNRELSDRDLGTRDRNVGHDTARRDRTRSMRYRTAHSGGSDVRRGDLGGMRRRDVAMLGNPALGQVRGNRDVNLLRGSDDWHGLDSERTERETRDERWNRHNRQLRDFAGDRYREARGDERHVRDVDREYDHTSRGGFGARGQFSRLRDQHGRLIDEQADQSRNYYGHSRQWDDETRSRWRGSPVDVDRQHYTDEDEDDRRLRGLRGDIDTRGRQFASHINDVGDDMRGQFYRSRDDGELGRRGLVEDVRVRDARRGDVYQRDTNRDDVYRGDDSRDDVDGGDEPRGDVDDYEDRRTRDRRGSDRRGLSHENMDLDDMNIGMRMTRDDRRGGGGSGRTIERRHTSRGDLRHGDGRGDDGDDGDRRGPRRR